MYECTCIYKHAFFLLVRSPSTAHNSPNLLHASLHYPLLEQIRIQAGTIIVDDNISRSCDFDLYPNVNKIQLWEAPPHRTFSTLNTTTAGKQKCNN